MRQLYIVPIAIFVAGNVLATDGSIGFNGRVVASACSVSHENAATEPSVSCFYTPPPRIAVQRHPEPQLLLSRHDTVYVVTYH
jgi:hypothetical protein